MFRLRCPLAPVTHHPKNQNVRIELHIHCAFRTFYTPAMVFKVSYGTPVPLNSATILILKVDSP